jgi:hypothetical protein
VMDFAQKPAAGGAEAACCHAQTACPPSRSPCSAAVRHRAYRGGDAGSNGDVEA